MNRMSYMLLLIAIVIVSVILFVWSVYAERLGFVSIAFFVFIIALMALYDEIS